MNLTFEEFVELLVKIGRNIDESPMDLKGMYEIVKYANQNGIFVVNSNNARNAMNTLDITAKQNRLNAINQERQDLERELGL